MKQYRWIWILAAAAVLLTVIFIIVDRNSKRNEEKAHIGEPKQLFQIDPDDVTAISLENEEGKTVFTWNSDAVSWEITEGEKFNLNNFAVSAICNYMCTLKSLKTVAFDCENTGVYGFTDPITLKVYSEKTDKDHPYTLYVGDATPTYDAYYAMVEGSNDVYTIDYNSGTVFCSNRNSLKNRYLFDTNSSLVTYYKLMKDDKVVYEFDRDENYTWEMKQPAPFKLSIASMNALMDIIVRVEIQSFIEDNPEDLAKYGLDHPHTKVWLEGGSHDMPLKEEIWFGDMLSSDENETQIYGYLANSGQVFAINRTETSFTEKKITELMFTSCVEIDIRDLKSVEIDMGEVYDLHETLYTDYEANQYKLGDINITAKDDENISQLFQNFYLAVSGLQFSDVDLDSKPDPDKEPAMQIIYNYKNGKKLTLDFIEKASNNYYIVQDGSYTGLTIRLNHFTSAGCVTENYKTLMDALN